MDKQQKHTKRHFDRILKQYALSQSQFDSLLKMPLTFAFESVRDAVETGSGPLECLLPSEFALKHLPEKIRKSSWSQTELCRQIMIDRPFQFYLTKRLNDVPNKAFKHRIQIQGLDILERQIRKSHRVIFLNSHMGPGQLGQIILARLGYKFTSLAARDFYQMLEIQLPDIQVHELGKNMGAQAIAAGLQALKINQNIHMTGDGYAGSSGELFSFFGEKRRFAGGFAYMADLAQVPVVPFFVDLDPVGQISLTITPAIQTNRKIENRQERLNKMVDIYVKRLRKKWRQSPSSVPPGTIRKLAGLPPLGLPESETGITE